MSACYELIPKNFVSLQKGFLKNGLRIILVREGFFPQDPQLCPPRWVPGPRAVGEALWEERLSSCEPMTLVCESCHGASLENCTACLKAPWGGRSTLRRETLPAQMTDNGGKALLSGFYPPHSSQPCLYASSQFPSPLLFTGRRKQSTRQEEVCCVKSLIPFFWEVHAGRGGIGNGPAPCRFRLGSIQISTLSKFFPFLLPPQVQLAETVNAQKYRVTLSLDPQGQSHSPDCNL